MSAASRREAILAFIAEYRDEHGYAPTMREIGEACSIPSSSNVAYHVRVLVRQGRLTHTPGRPRTLRVA